MFVLKIPSELTRWPLQLEQTARDGSDENKDIRVVANFMSQSKSANVLIRILKM